MAFQIKSADGSVQDALRRIADEQIGRALTEIDGDAFDVAETIHQVRKRCKKLRGLVRLVRPVFKGYGEENQAFRDAARRLSDLRDARTLIETYDAVTTHFGDRIDRRAFAQIRARLTRDASKLRSDPRTDERLAAFRLEMEAARDRAATWKLSKVGVDAVAGGLGKTYGRARKQMRAVLADPTDEAMHDWRKRVKYHWYHARLLREIWPGVVGAHAQAADELSDLLGDHHDLAVFDSRLRKAPGDFGMSADLKAFRALIEARKAALAERAFALGRPLLAEPKAALVRRWGGYWKVRA